MLVINGNTELNIIQMVDLKELSRINYQPNGNKPDDQELQTGCLQRIADATELMATSHLELQKELQRLKASENYWIGEFQKKTEEKNALYRRISSLQGVITKMKKKAGSKRL